MNSRKDFPAEGPRCANYKHSPMSNKSPELQIGTSGPGEQRRGLICSIPVSKRSAQSTITSLLSGLSYMQSILHTSNWFFLLPRLLGFWKIFLPQIVSALHFGKIAPLPPVLNPLPWFSSSHVNLGHITCVHPWLLFILLHPSVNLSYKPEIKCHLFHKDTSADI